MRFHNNKAKQKRSSKMNSKESSSNVEKMKKWREQKIAKKKEADRKYYERNHERKIANMEEYKSWHHTAVSTAKTKGICS